MLEVKEISYQSFFNCKKLNNIEINNVEIIGDYAFCNCENLKNVIVISSSVIFL